MSSATINKMTACFVLTTSYRNVEFTQQVQSRVVLIDNIIINKGKERTLTSTPISEGYIRDAERADTVSATFLNWP